MAGAVAHEAQAKLAGRHYGIARDDLVTGLAGLGFVVVTVIQNGVLLAGAPRADASIAEISEFFAENELSVSLALALVAVNIPLSLVFASGFSTLLGQRAGGLIPVGARAGFAGAVAVIPAFAVVATARATLVANADILASEPALTQMLWDVHSAAFAFAQVSLAVALVAFALAGRDAGLTPTWLTILALGGGAALVVSGGAVVPVMDGSAVGLLGLLGFFAWLVFLVVQSIRLLRGSSAPSS
jgi:hypothetical protein